VAISARHDRDDDRARALMSVRARPGYALLEVYRVLSRFPEGLVAQAGTDNRLIPIEGVAAV
jgi:hypothetical protein